MQPCWSRCRSSLRRFTTEFRFGPETSEGSFLEIQPSCPLLVDWGAASVPLPPPRPEPSAVRQEQDPAWQFPRLGGLAGELDLTLICPQAHPVTVSQTEAGHVVRVHRKGAGLFQVSGRELAFVQGRPLPAGAAGDEDEGLRLIPL